MALHHSYIYSSNIKTNGNGSAILLLLWSLGGGIYNDNGDGTNYAKQILNFNNEFGDVLRSRKLATELGEVFK